MGFITLVCGGLVVPLSWFAAGIPRAKFACAVGVRLPDEQREEPRRGSKGSSDALAGVRSKANYDIIICI